MILFQNTDYSTLPGHFYSFVLPTPVAKPEWLARNEKLADQLNLGISTVFSSAGLRVFSGNELGLGSKPIATAYSGHQFGHFVPTLGDGRAILLGDVVGRNGLRYEIQLKGSGPTPYSRNGDGRAALGPVLREYIVSEAMAALGIPTTRSLCAIKSGEDVYREKVLPGAILTRVARSHLRVGSFEYHAHRRDSIALRELTKFAIIRLYPQFSNEEHPANFLLTSVILSQADLVAKWLSLGFVHGVMNTDNMAISGETIDYGPCAFLDSYAPMRTFSSIDRYGRYAYKAQPECAYWNLARFAESLMPLFIEQHKEPEVALRELENLLSEFPKHFEKSYLKYFRAKLGLAKPFSEDSSLIEDFLEILSQEKADFTLAFRAISGDKKSSELCQRHFLSPEYKNWEKRWLDRLAQEEGGIELRKQSMLEVNPLRIPRNHLIEQAISAAISGDLSPFERLHSALENPFVDHPFFDELMSPPGEEQWQYRTFCGT